MMTQSPDSDMLLADEERRDRSLTAAPSAWMTVLVALICGFLIPNRMLARAGDPNDSDVFAYIGWLMNRGYVPYRDVWDHKGPVLYFLNWLGWKLTPDSTVGIGVFQALVYAVGFWALMRVLMRIGVGVVPIGCALFFSVAALSQVTEGGDLTETWALGVIAVAYWICYDGLAKEPRAWHFAALGACAGLCFWMRPNLALLPGLAILAVAHSKRLRSGFAAGLLGLCIAAASGLVISAASVMPVWTSGAFPAFRESYFLYNSAYSRFTSLRHHVVGFAVLLTYVKGMGLMAGTVVAYVLLLRRHPSGWPPVFRTLLLVSLPLEVANAGLSGRPYFHYLAPVVPTATILCAWALHRWWTLPAVRSRSLIAVAVLVFVIFDGRRYVVYTLGRLQPSVVEVDVAHYIDRVTSPGDHILPVGDNAASAAALRARREPAGPFVYNLAMIHRANVQAHQQQQQELQTIEQLKPKVVFSINGLAGNLCGPASSYWEPMSTREGYDYNGMRNLLHSVLTQNYTKVDVGHDSACVYVLRQP